jgi:DNA-binding protein HU-beta
MNHTELVGKIADAMEISKPQADRTLDAVVQTILDTLKAGGDVRITGLGVFDVTSREARQGRNPKTQEAVEIPAAKVVRFRAGKAVRDQMNPN